MRHTDNQDNQDIHEDHDNHDSQIGLTHLCVDFRFIFLRSGQRPFLSSFHLGFYSGQGGLGNLLAATAFKPSLHTTSIYTNQHFCHKNALFENHLGPGCDLDGHTKMKLLQHMQAYFQLVLLIFKTERKIGF